MPKLTTPVQSPARRAPRADGKRAAPSQKKYSKTENREAAAEAYRTLAAGVWGVIAPPLGYVAGLFSDALFFLRPFLGLALAMSVVAALVWIAFAWAHAQVWGPAGLAAMAVEPITSAACAVPILSFAPWCRRPDKPADKTQAPFENLVALQDSFSKVLDIAQEGASLPTVMSLSEAPVLELRDVIKFQSELPSKHQLVAQFDSFVQLSRTTSAELGTFNSHVGGAVDKIISMNRYTLRVLETVRRAPDSNLVGRISNLLPGAGRRLTAADVVAQYLRHADKVEEQSDALIVEAEALLRSLNAMDAQLDVIRETAAHDNAVLANKRTEIFAGLWTSLGFNSKKKAALDRNIAIGARLHAARSDAARVVRMTLLELRALKSGVADLRARILAPRSWADDAVDPLEVEEHVRYVEDGLARLYARRREQAGRERAVIDRALSHARDVFEGGGSMLSAEKRKEISG
jgi:hypothetical protein